MTTDSPITVREASFRLFRDFGMTTIFGNPGSTELPMFRNFPNDFRYVLALQESVAVGMADGFAQTTRNAALVNLHSAVGVGHALGNIFTAFRNRAPMVIVAGQQARSILPYQPFLFAEQAPEFPKPYVKWSCEPARAEDVPAAIARAYYIAMQPPCGPTFVSVPIDDWDRTCEPLDARTISRTMLGDAALLGEVADALHAARRPAFVVGAEVARDSAWDEVIALAERHQAEVWVSPMSSRNSFPEDHPLFAGFLFAGREEIVGKLAGCDLVLVLGAQVFTYHVEGFGPHVPEGAKLFQLTEDPSIASFAPVGTTLITSLKPALAALAAAPGKEQRRPPAVHPRPAAPPANPLGDRYLVHRISELRPRGSIIVEEAPSTREPMHDYLPITEPDSFYTCASGGLGYALPASIGVALGRPGEKVICLLGDGSAMYAVQSLWTAAQLRLPISFVVVNNGGYEALNGFSKRFGLSSLVGTEIGGLDFVEIAHGQGMKAVRVSDSAALDAALKQSFDSPEASLVEVVIA